VIKAYEFWSGLVAINSGAGLEIVTSLSLMTAVKYSGFHQAFGYVAWWILCCLYRSFTNVSRGLGLAASPKCSPLHRLNPVPLAERPITKEALWTESWPCMISSKIRDIATSNCVQRTNNGVIPCTRLNVSWPQE